MRFIPLLTILSICLIACEVENSPPPEPPKLSIGDTEEEIDDNLAQCHTLSQLEKYELHDYGLSRGKRRILDFGLEHKMSLVVSKKAESPKINYWLHGDSIKLIIRFPKWQDSLETHEDRIIRADWDFLEKHARKYNDFYGSQLDAQQLVLDLVERESVRVACGYSDRGYSKAMKQVYRHSLAGEKAPLDSLLRSASPEKQAMGAIGLLNMENKGTGELSEWENRIIQHILDRNTATHFCQGCTADYYPAEFYIVSYSDSMFPHIPF